MVGRLNKGAKRYSSKRRKIVYFNIKEIKFKQIFNRVKYFPNIVRRANFIGRRIYKRGFKILKKYIFFSKKKIKKITNKFVKRNILKLKFFILKNEWLFNYSRVRNIYILKKSHKYRSYLGKINMLLLEKIIKKNISSKNTLENIKFLTKKIFYKLLLLRKYIIKNSTLRKRRNYNIRFGTAFSIKSKKNLYHFDSRHIFVFSRFLRFSFKFFKKVSLTAMHSIHKRRKRIDIYKEYLKENKIIVNNYVSYKNNIKNLLLCCLVYEEKI